MKENMGGEGERCQGQRDVKMQLCVYLFQYLLCSQLSHAVGSQCQICTENYQQPAIHCILLSGQTCTPYPKVLSNEGLG